MTDRPGPPMLINRNFSLLWAAQAISQTGDFVFDTTLTLWVGTVLLDDRTYAPAAVSGLLATVAVATLLVAPLAGVHVDRWDRQRIMLASDLIRATVIGATAALAILPDHTLPAGVTVALVYLAVFLNAGVSQFFNPARFALTGEIVAKEQRAKAAGIGQSTQAIASILGPSLAAPLLYTAGLRWALILNTASFLVSYMLLHAIRPPAATTTTPSGPANFRKELMAGLHMTASNTVVRAVLVVIVIVTIGSQALYVVNVFFVTDNLHADPQWYGTFYMALGLGMLGGAVLATPLGRRLGHRRAFSLGLAVTGLLLVGYSRATGLAAALAIMVAVGVAMAVLNAALAPVLVDAVPPSYLGRVFSVLNPVQKLAGIIGTGLAGWLASTVPQDFHASLGGLHLGRIDTILTLSGLLIALGGLYSIRSLHERSPSGTANADHAPPTTQTAEHTADAETTASTSRR